MRFLTADFEPKLLTTLREGYAARDFARDAFAGIVVGVVAFPLAIAFAIASGVRPEQGLYTAIIAGFVISALGGSRVQIGGPTGAFVVLIAGAPDVPANVEVFEINGSFCFGAARKFTETILASQSAPKVVILRMRNVLAMDATGLYALEDVAARLRRRGASLLLSGIHAQPLIALEQSGGIERIGEEHLFDDFADAVAHARILVGQSG